MKTLHLFAVLVTLPLLLGGCGEKITVEPVAEVGPQLDGVNLDQLEKREGIQYLSGSDTPYTGKAFALYENGQKEAEANFKDGKPDGLQVAWHENGQKSFEVIFISGEAVEESYKYWAIDGARVLVNP